MFRVIVFCLLVSFIGGVGFDSPAKLASRPRMRVLPHLGGTFYCPFMLSLGTVDIALRPLYCLKYKNLPDAEYGRRPCQFGWIFRLFSLVSSPVLSGFSALKLSLVLFFGRHIFFLSSCCLPI